MSDYKKPNIVNWSEIPERNNVMVDMPYGHIFAFQDEDGTVFNTESGDEIKEFTVLSRRDVASNVISRKVLFKPEPVNHDGDEPPQGKFDYINWDVVPELSNVLVKCNLGRVYAVQHTNGTCIDGLTGAELKDYRVLARRPGTQHETGYISDESTPTMLHVKVNASADMKKLFDSIKDDDFESYRELPEFLKKWVQEQKEKLLNGTNKSGETPIGLIGDTDLSVTTSQRILAEAGETQVNRGVTYDAPSGERSMGKTVAMFNTYSGLNLTEEQGWHFMEILKMVRSSQGNFKLDNYVDGCSYASLAGEAAARDRGNNS